MAQMPKFDKSLPPGNLVNRRAAAARGLVYDYSIGMYRARRKTFGRRPIVAYRDGTRVPQFRYWGPNHAVM